MVDELRRISFEEYMLKKEMCIPSLGPRREASLLIMSISKFKVGVIEKGVISVIVQLVIGILGCS